MAEREAEHRRIVVETPRARREVEHTEAVHHHSDGNGISGAALAAIVVGVIALAAIVILFVINKQQPAETAHTEQPPTTIVQQPAQQPPIIVQQPAPATQPAPVIVNNPAPSGGAASSVSGADDASVQAAIDKTLSEDPTLSPLGITATVLDGKVTLTGSVRSAGLKGQVERAVRNIKGVKSIDNQITVG